MVGGVSGQPPFPLSDHCDGTRFFNPSGIAPRGFASLPKWWWQQQRGQGTPWPKTVPPPRPPQLPAQVPGDSVAVTFIGHSTFLLQFAGLTVITDPVLASRAGPFGRLGPKRLRPAALTLVELPRVDVVVLSHNHYDHLDLGTLRGLSRLHAPRVIAPLGLKAWLEGNGVKNAVELDWWQPHAPRADVTITCTPAQHWSTRHPWDRAKTLWGGFWIKTSAGAVYFAGDSGWHEPLFQGIRQQLGAPDLALLPIGAYEPRWFMQSVHMNPDEAVRAHLALHSRQSLGMHFGTFKLTDEGIDAPLHDLARARLEHDVTESVFTTLDFGETRLIRLVA